MRGSYSSSRLRDIFYFFPRFFRVLYPPIINIQLKKKIGLFLEKFFINLQNLNFFRLGESFFLSLFFTFCSSQLASEPINSINNLIISTKA